MPEQLYRLVHSTTPPEGWTTGSWALADDDDIPGWLVPVKTAKVFRMVATKPDGKLKRWPFAKEAAAAKHLADLRIDIAKRPECGYHDPYLQSRQVTPWT